MSIETHYTYMASMDSDSIVHMTLAGYTPSGASVPITRTRLSNLYVFQFIEEGRGMLEVEGNIYTPQAGDVILTCAGSNHHYEQDPGSPWQKSWFNCQGKLVAALVDSYALHEVSWVPKCREVGKLIRDTIFALPRLHRDEVDDFTAQQVLQIAQHLSRHIKNTQKAFTHMQPAALQLQGFLHDHVMGGAPSLAQMSRQVAMSPGHLSRIFRKTFGLSPYAYLLTKKIDTAADLLRNSKLEIKDIATQLGFSNVFYFSRIFKRKKGLSPGQFRKGM